MTEIETRGEETLPEAPARAKKNEGPSFETIKELRAFKPREDGKDRIVRDRLIEGGRVVIRPSGARSYLLLYEIGGVAKKHTLVAGLDLDTGGLAKARKLARSAQNALEDARAGRGLDPVAAKQESRRLAAIAAEEARIAEMKAEANTFGAVAELYLDMPKVKALRPVTQRERRRQFNTELLPLWRDRPITSITDEDVNALLDPIAATRVIMANRIYSTLTHFFKWSQKRKHIATNPMVDVERPLKEETPRSRVLSGAELAVVWRASARLDTPWREFFRLAILTGARKSELARAPWSEFDLDRAEWTLPAARAKNKLDLVRPLAPATIALLQSLPRLHGSPWVFGSPLTAFQRAKRHLDRAIVEVNGAPLPPFTIHDFRRGLATGLQKLGVKLEVSERLLGHRGASQSGVAQVYALHDFGAEKVAAVGAWADHVRELVGPEPEPERAKVIAMSSRRVSAPASS